MSLRVALSTANIANFSLLMLAIRSFRSRFICSALFWIACPAAHAAELPKSVVAQLPPTYEAMTFRAADLNGDKSPDYLVVAHRAQEQQIYEKSGNAPRRPLLVFVQNADKSFVLAARNDAVVYALDEGGQCDPFEDGEEGLAIKGAYFTVQNSVACGQHWTDYITFRYTPDLKNWVFHKRISESWIMNPSTKPDAEALIPGKRKVTSARRDKTVLLRDYKPD